MDVPSGPHIHDGLAPNSLPGRDAPLFPRAVARAAAVGTGLLVIATIAGARPPLAGWHLWAAWAAAAAVAVTFPLAMRRHSSPGLLAGAAAVCGGSGVLLQALSFGSTGLMVAIMALLQASRLEPPLGALLAGAIGIAYEAAAVTQPHDLSTILASAAGLTCAYLAASSYRRLRAEQRTTALLLREVLAGQEARVEAARLGERARLAREIHDILAHTLSALAVQLEGTRLLVEQRPGDPAAVAAVARASALTRDGLEEARRAVGALRGDALPGPEELPHLATAFERDSGVPCHVSVEGTPATLSPEARLALYRTAQEALSNVRKHADAVQVVIALRYAEQATELAIEDTGTARVAPLMGGGHGLAGMRERAALAHGRLEAGPTPTGFKVVLWLPA